MSVTLSLTDRGIIAAGIPKSVKEKLRSCARVPKLYSNSGATLGWHQTPAYSNLKHFSPGAILLPAGLLELTNHLLDAANIPVSVSTAAEIVPRTFAPHLETKLVQRFNDQNLIDLVEHHRLAIVRHGEVFNVADAVAQLSAAYPRATFAVLAATHDVVDQIVGRVFRLGIACYAATTDFNPPDNARVVVGTVAGLARYSVAVEHRDFLMDADVLSNLSVDGKSPVRYAWRARKYGFLRADARLSPSAEFLLRSHYGFRELQLPRHGTRQRDVVVCWQKIGGGPKIARDCQTLVGLKRAAYWNNDLACRLVASFARELSRKSFSTPASPFESTASSSERASRVVIVVENIEQASRMAAVLPAWPIMVAGDNEVDAWLSSFIAQRRTTAFPCTNAIVTLAAVQNVNWAIVDAVVRADGGAGLIPLPADALAVNASSAVQPLLVVDLNDRRHPQLGNWSRQRNQAYDQAGWFRLGADRLAEQIRVFLQDHEGRR